MAVYSRTVFVCSLLRGLSRRRSSCFNEMLQQHRSNTGVNFSSVQFNTWRKRHSWSPVPALSVNLTSTWTSHRRALTSEAPYKEDEYPPLPDYAPAQEPDTKEVFIIRVKGLPWTCTVEDLMNFFSECQIRGGVNGIHLMNKNGRPNGQAFIELEQEKDISKALERHRQYLGPRYVEVYEVTNRDAEAILKGTDESPSADGVVRLRGLPFNCTEEEIIQFFSGLDIIKDGVTLVLDYKGRNSGDAYVQFATQEMADKAMQRDKEVIGNRYIEVFPSKKTEIQNHHGRARGETSGSGLRTQRTNTVSVSTHYIHMRGLPYQATAGDIVNFFYPTRVAKVLMEYGPDGRARGEAEAYFNSHQDAITAMSKDRQRIQDRYIELFLNSAIRGEGN